MMLSALLLATAIAAPQTPVTLLPATNERVTYYDWMARHREVVDRVRQGNVDLLMIGDSITHGWNRTLWDMYYAPRKAVNMGFGSDGTQHVLWRLQNGEIDGISPKVAVLLIGVNNIGWCTAEDTFRGVEKVVETLNAKLPTTEVLVLGVFPWKERPDAPERAKIKDLNARIATLDARPRVTFLDFGHAFLEKDGSLSKEVMPDFLHLSPKGYRIWVARMEPTLKRLMGEP